MEVFLIICALLATGLAGYFMVKGFKPAIVLLFAGLFLITISTILIPELSPVSYTHLTLPTNREV